MRCLSERSDPMWFPSKSSGFPARWKKSSGFPAKWKSHFPRALYQLESLMLFLNKSIVASSRCKKSVSDALLQISHSFGQLLVSNRNSQQGVSLRQKILTCFPISSNTWGFTKTITELNFAMNIHGVERYPHLD